MDSQYLIKQDPFFDTRERLIVEEYVFIHKKNYLEKKNCQFICIIVLSYYIILLSKPENYLDPTRN